MSGAARFFQALGDETRLALLLQLRAGEKTVGALVEALGCPQPKVSRHLKVLKDVGLVRDRREGRHVRYGLATSSQWGREPREWIEQLDAGLLPAEMMPTRPARSARPPRRPPSRPSGASPRPRPAIERPEPPESRSDLETYLL